MLCKHETNPQENKNAEAQSQQSRFATLFKSHPRTDTPRKFAAHPQNTLLRENTSEGLHGKRNLKELNYKKFLFTVVKINLLALKMNK